MVIIDKLYLATLTKNDKDAGTDSDLNLTINIDGLDAVDYDFENPLIEAGGAGLEVVESFQPGFPTSKFDPFDSSALTNSSIRLGIRDDDMWHPEHVLLLGRAERMVLALAVEVDIMVRLSTDNVLGGDNGKLSMSLRLVGSGNSSTVIYRVLLLVETSNNDNAGTDNPIEIRITAGGINVMQQEIIDTSQPDLEQGTFNWYFLDVAVPFTRSDVLLNGEIRLRILGTDAWLPRTLFVLGFDTEDGRPTEIVTLVSVPEWNMGWLSTDTNEGQPSYLLPVI
jgi:hypothetical protein